MSILNEPMNWKKSSNSIETFVKYTVDLRCQTLSIWFSWQIFISSLALFCLSLYLDKNHQSLPFRNIFFVFTEILLFLSEFFFYDLCGWSYFVLAELCFCDNLNWLSDIFVINSFIKQCYVDISLKIVKYSYLNAPTEPLLKQENNQTKESTSSFQGNLFAVSLAFLGICLTFLFSPA